MHSNFLQLAMQIRSADPGAQFKVKWHEVLRAFITKGMGLPDAESWIEMPDDNPPLPIELQIDLIKAHRKVVASPSDNHEQAIKQLIQIGTTDPVFKYDPECRALLEDLVLQHVALLQQQMQEAQAQAQAMMMAQLQAAQGGQPGGPPGPGGAGGSLPALAPNGAAPPQVAAPTDMGADMMRSMSQQ